MPLELLDLKNYVLNAHARLCAAGGAQIGHPQSIEADKWMHLCAPLDEALLVAEKLPFALPVSARLPNAASVLATRRAHWDAKGFARLESGGYVTVVEARKGCGPSGLELRALDTNTWLDFLLWQFKPITSVN